MVIYAQLEESDINKPPISPLFRNRKGVLAKLSGHFFVLWQKKYIYYHRFIAPSTDSRASFGAIKLNFGVLSRQIARFFSDMARQSIAS